MSTKVIFLALINIALAGRYGIDLGDLFTGTAGGSSSHQHGVRGTVSVVNSNTFFIANFSYDGKAPDAHFWVGMNDPLPSPNGIIVPDELGTEEPLKKYENRNVVISLPKGHKISDVKWLSVWCRSFAADFGHVLIPEGFLPPAPKVLRRLRGRAHKVRSGSIILIDSKTIQINDLYYDGNGPDAFFLVGRDGMPNGNGIKVPDEEGSLSRLHGYQGDRVVLRLPGSYTWFDIKWFALYCIMAAENFGEVYINGPLNIPVDLSDLPISEHSPALTNCHEIFPDRLLMRWKIQESDIYIQLEGRVDVNEYVAFGVSGSEDEAKMVGADVVVAFYNQYTAVVDDYYLTYKTQCSGEQGACPDVNQGGKQNVVLLEWKYVNGILNVIYKRPLNATEDKDKPIKREETTTVVAAIGKVNDKMEVAIHSTVTRDTLKIHFGKNEQNCDSLEGKSKPEPTVQPWTPLKISDTKVFTAQIGPSGAKRGYTAITGIVGWGIAWWINGLLIPEITVKRGVNYTFIVEGGDDPSIRTEYHPFYITNNKIGGGINENIGTPEHIVYAGVEKNKSGHYIPIGVGRYCEYKHISSDQSDNTNTFEEFKETLYLDCVNGTPGEFTWMPDSDTPDLVYYQCYTHRNLGWKIHVSGSSMTGLFVSIKWLLLHIVCILTIFSKMD